MTRRRVKADPFIGPRLPALIRWQRAGEPGWPFNHDGGKLPPVINDGASDADLTLKPPRVSGARGGR